MIIFYTEPDVYDVKKEEYMFPKPVWLTFDTLARTLKIQTNAFAD